jgi:hypothetical protein
MNIASRMGVQIGRCIKAADIKDRPVQKSVDSVPELIDNIEEVRNDREPSREPTSLRGESLREAPDDRGARERTETPEPPTPVVGAGESHAAPNSAGGASMASVQMPEASYSPSIPQELVQEGAISRAQLVPVIYAGEAWQTYLGDGQRRGLMLEDNTGTGKGRTLAAMIIDQMRRGGSKKRFGRGHGDSPHPTAGATGPILSHGGR